MPLTWTDQPNELVDAVSFGSFSIQVSSDFTVRAEVRTKLTGLDGQPLWWYLTVSTLFGSQTIKCKQADIVLEVLCTIGKPDFVLPKGVELMKGNEL